MTTDAWVLDASIAMRWVLEDQATPETDDLLLRVSIDDVHVPDLWRYEVAQVLVRECRRGALPDQRALAAANRLYSLDIVVDGALTRSSLLECMGWSAGLGLKLPDAVYVDLAYRRGVPLATLDTVQADAARRIGVDVLWPTAS